jgi:hypothetical protein
MNDAQLLAFVIMPIFVVVLGLIAAWASRFIP